MPSLRISANFTRLDAFEVRLCRPLNAIAKAIPIRTYFRFISRIGDWPLWVGLLVALPLVFGKPAVVPVIHMAVTALAGIVIYKSLKLTLIRERPFASHRDVCLFSKPMDRYSFPSGHTLQATCFMVMLATYFPTLMWLLLPLAISIAVSRVVLGLHYPTDVAAGALIGFALARVSFLVSAPTPPVL
ncbi:MAG TPA: phosphatase PAP2 family protein [Xanthomonadales bacterium]|nr:phosphatase PAP2 family protein [Xanthomonadales bacterium]